MVRRFSSVIRSAPTAALLSVACCGSAAGQAARADAPGVSEVAPAAAESQNDRFRAAMDRVFGPGGWRETSGYRSPERENQLRLEGAGTVPAGRISAHSLGTPDAPGAYDAVVYGMSLARAASALKTADEGFSRVLVEAAHGPEGPHLHIEVGDGLGAGSSRRVAGVIGPSVCDSIYLRVVDGRRNPRLSNC